MEGERETDKEGDGELGGGGAFTGVFKNLGCHPKK